MAIETIGLYPITIDVYKKHKESTVYANDNDMNGRGLLINLVKNNASFDSTGITLKIGFRNAVGEERLYDCDIVDVLTGQYKVFYPTEMLVGNGGRVVKLEIKAYESTGALLNYAPIFVYVNASEIPDEAISGTNEASYLKQLTDEVLYVQDQLGGITQAEIDGVVTLNDTILPLETERQSKESARLLAETDRLSSETARKSGETARISQESARMTAETVRVNTESARVISESARATSESDRVTTEGARTTNENTRIATENTRVINEGTRTTTESARVTAETGRQSAESARNTNETTRLSSENERVDSEVARKGAESTRVTNENARVLSENSRTGAESGRVTAESGRMTAESARVGAESSRVTAEGSRVTAEVNRATFYDGFSAQLEEKAYKFGDFLYFYDNYNEFKALTGGFSKGFDSHPLEEVITKTEKQFNCLKLLADMTNGVGGNVSEISFSTTEAIDLTDINTLYIDWENTGSTTSVNNQSYFIAGSIKDDNHNSFSSRLTLNQSFARRLSALDVSSLQGEYYIRVHSRNSAFVKSEVKIYRVFGGV